MSFRRGWGVVLVVIMLLGGLLFSVWAPLRQQLFERLAAQRMAADGATQLPDGLHVGLCGAGSPLPDPRRSAPCTLVIAGKRTLVFDAGNTAAIKVGAMGFDIGKVQALFLTHFHSDHIGGVGELMLQRWVGGIHQQPLPVHGPAGVEEVVAGFNQAYTQDAHYRVAHHGSTVVIPSGFGGRAMPFQPTGPEMRVIVVDEPDLQIVAFNVDHSPIHPAVGYRIRYKDRTLVISGDTKQSAAVEREAKGVDVLVHEALSMPLVQSMNRAANQAGRPNLAQIMTDIQNYHTSPEQAAETAQSAGAGYLLLTHIVPQLPLPGLQKVFLGDATERFDGPIKVGVDGDFISLPANSTEILVSNRL